MLTVGFEGGVGGRWSDDRGVEGISVSWKVFPRVGGLLMDHSIGELGRMGFSSEVSLARSSHFPRTTSKLLPTRCDGVHLLVLVGVADDPFGFVKIPMPDCELLRDSDPPPPRDEVRSSSLVW
jgi:hypothetical protein